MTPERAAQIIRSHGPDAWAYGPDSVVAMDVTTERRPGGIVYRAVPVVLPTCRHWIMLWLGY